MPYLVSDLCEGKISSMREGILTGGAHTDVTVLDIIHLTPKVKQLSVEMQKGDEKVILVDRFIIALALTLMCKSKRCRPDLLHRLKMPRKYRTGILCSISSFLCTAMVPARPPPSMTWTTGTAS